MSTIKSSCFALAACAIAAVFSGHPANAQSFNDTLGPQFLITVNPGNVFSVTAGPGFAQGPYDGVEDAYIGVVNNSGATVNSFALSSPIANDGGIYSFDGDGINAYGAVKVAGNPDTSGYGGP